MVRWDETDVRLCSTIPNYTGKEEIVLALTPWVKTLIVNDSASHISMFIIPYLDVKITHGGYTEIWRLLTHKYVYDFKCSDTRYLVSTR